MMEKLFYFVGQDIHVGVTIVFVCCVFTVVAALFDMWTALEAVRASGGRPSSHPMKRTGAKIVDYLRLIFFVLMVDVLGVLCFSFYLIPYCVVLITVGILLREGLSMRENFKMKKSNAVAALDITQKIVECLNKEDAGKIIAHIQTAAVAARKHEKNMIKE